MLIRWDLKLFILFVLMSNSFVSKDVAVEVAVVDRKVSTVEGGSSGERERQEGRERKGERKGERGRESERGGGHQIMM